jgi:hypothetical protein
MVHRAGFARSFSGYMLPDSFWLCCAACTFDRTCGIVGGGEGSDHLLWDLPLC